jgi:hypothetical protein
LIERTNQKETEESKDTINLVQESLVEKGSDLNRNDEILDMNSGKQVSYKRNLILLNPVPSANDFSFAMDKNEGLFDLYELKNLSIEKE